MTDCVAFLRAVNVGGNNKVPMAALRDALGAEGLEDVTTILQSGNVLFRASGSAQAATDLVTDTIEKSFGLRIGVVVRTARQIAAVASSNPFLDDEPGRDPKTLHVAFLSARPTVAAVAKRDPDRFRPDAALVAGSEAYLSYPSGSGRTKLTLDYLERTLGVTGTARNWRTVQRLLTILED